MAFKEHILDIRDFKYGLISDGHKPESPVESVQDTLNVDYKQYVERRSPIQRLDDLIELDAGYSLFKVVDKIFTDKTGNQVTVRIAFAKHATLPLKIYTSHYYNPDRKVGDKYYQNGLGEGWQSEYRDITKKITFDYYAADYQHQDKLVIKTDTPAITAMTAHYLRGKFVFHKPTGATEHRCLGMIVENFLNPSYVGDDRVSLVIELNIKKDTTPNTIDKEITLDEMDGDGLQDLFICDYPVIANYDFSGVTKVNVADLPSNAVVITFGKDKRPLYLGFIVDRQYGKTYKGGEVREDDETDQTADDIEIYNVGGALNRYRIKNVSDGLLQNGDYIQITDCSNPAFIGQIHQVVNYVSASEVYLNDTCNNVATGTNATFKIINERTLFANNYDGFWFGYLTPNIENKKKVIAANNKTLPNSGLYESKDAGIFNSVSFNKYLAPAEQIIITCIVEYDGYQSFFLRMAAGKGVHILFHTYLNNDYDRRITAVKTFWRQSDSEVYVTLADDTIAEIELDNNFYVPYQLSKARMGDVSVKEFDIHTANNSYYCTNYFTNYSQIYANPENNGIDLNTYLGTFYYNNVNINFDDLVFINGYVVAWGLKYESEDKDMYYPKQMIVSSLQQGIVPTTACFSVERIIEADTKVKKVCKLYSNRIAYFDERDFVVLEIQDIVRLTTDEKYRGLNITAVNSNCIVEAKHKNQYGGIYWISVDGEVYRYVNDNVEPLTKGRIQDEFSLVDKTNIIAAYHFQEKDVWFYKDKDTIYVYDVLYSNWRKYALPYNVTGIYGSDEGYLVLYVSGNIMKKDKFTSLSHDYDIVTEVDNIIGIDFKLHKYTNFGTNETYKIFHRLEAIGEYTVEDGSGLIEIKVKDESGNEIMATQPKTLTKVNQGTLKRVPSTFHKIEIKVINPVKVKSFKLHQLTIDMMIRTRDLTV